MKSKEALEIISSFNSALKNCNDIIDRSYVLLVLPKTKHPLFKLYHRKKSQFISTLIVIQEQGFNIFWKKLIPAAICPSHWCLLLLPFQIQNTLPSFLLPSVFSFNILLFFIRFLLHLFSLYFFLPSILIFLTRSHLFFPAARLPSI